MNCPECGGKTAVIDSRAVKTKLTEYIRRRRECTCGERFNTFEMHSDTINAVTDFARQLKSIKAALIAGITEIEGIENTTI